MAPLLSLVVAAAALGNGAPAAAYVARCDCQVQPQHGETYREVITLRDWEAEDGATIERLFDDYRVDDSGATTLYRRSGIFVIGILSGLQTLTLERLADGSGKFSYRSTVINPHDFSHHTGTCTSEIAHAPLAGPPATGNNR